MPGQSTYRHSGRSDNNDPESKWTWHGYSGDTNFRWHDGKHKNRPVIYDSDSPFPCRDHCNLQIT